MYAYMYDDAKQYVSYFYFNVVKFAFERRENDDLRKNSIHISLTHSLNQSIDLKIEKYINTKNRSSRDVK